MKVLGRANLGGPERSKRAYSKRATSGHWDNEYNQHATIDYLAQKLCVKQLDEWYTVTLDDIHEFGASPLVWSKFGGSLITCLATIFPHHGWEPRKFVCAPRRYWQNHNNLKRVLNYIAEDVNVKQLSDWYDVTAINAKRYQAHGMLAIYAASLPLCVSSVFSDYPWIMWKFCNAPGAYWQSKQNRRGAMDIIGEELGLQTLEGWYYYGYEDIDEHNAGGLTQYYNHSLRSCVVDLYPDFEWEAWRFCAVPKFFWTQSENVRSYLEPISAMLHVHTLDDWHECTRQDLHSHVSFLNCNFDSSLMKALALAYPKHKFSKSSMLYEDPKKIRFWRSKHNQRQFLLAAQKTLNVHSTEAWYRVSFLQIQKMGGLGLYKHWPQVLALVDPKFNWNWNSFMGGNKIRAKQRTVLHQVRALLGPQ